MTKTEQKRIEKAEKAAFIRKAFGCVLDGIFESAQKVESKPQIKVTMTGGNRYINCHKYGQDFNIQLYTSGDVDIEFKEFCHEPRKIRLFAYTSEQDEQETFLEQFGKDMCMILTEFVGGASWHIVLDFMPREDMTLWREAFIDSLECAVDEEEPLRWNPGWKSKYREDE